MPKLSNHFSVAEFERSNTALRLGISNSMDGDRTGNAVSLCRTILDPLREHLNRPVRITSGYRCLDLNTVIGSHSGSQHIRGMAADIVVSGMKAKEVAETVIELGLPFDQLIYEGTWVHVSFSAQPRGKVMTAKFIGGKAHYSEGIS